MGRANRRPGAAASRLVEGARDRVADVDQLRVNACVLETDGHLRCARARAGDVADSARQKLEVGVPDPGDVTAVGDAVVQGDPEVEAPRVQPIGLEPEGAQDLVRAGGVLDQEDGDRGGADGDGLDAPEGGFHALQACDGSARLDAKVQRGRQRRERVVDVVEAGEREVQVEGAGRRGYVNLEPLIPSRLDRGRREIRLGPVSLAVGAGVVARDGQRRPARTHRGRHSGGSAWRRARAGAPGAPGMRPRCRSR